jgi:ubiquinol-cytochrome c reductase cytochrome c1 subunit
MLRKLLAKAVALAIAAALPWGLAAPAMAATTSAPLAHQPWSFSGPTGMYDQAQLQRGFKVYTEVCSQCHSIQYIHFHNLGDPGGPFWSPKYPNSNDNPYVKAIAANWPRQVTEINADTGDPSHRKPTGADVLVPPFPNDAAARASNGGALPPDMSLLAAAREGGPDYIYAIVTGFRPTPAGIANAPPGKYYNIAFPGDLSSYWKGDPNAVPTGGFISMPPPLTDCKVTFDDGTSCKLGQEARDVAAFLQWASDPKMDERKQTGIAVMIYLLIFTGILYASYRQIWRNVAH